MGKGKGKVTTWGFRISSGNYLLELKGLRYGRLLRLHKQLSNCLPAEVTTKAASTKMQGLYGMPAFYLI
jgi:ribosomal protein L16/L10AE